MEEQTMFDMQLRVISHFRSFFTQEGITHFDVAFRNMEIARLTAEIEEKDRKIEALTPNEKGENVEDDK